MLLFAISFILIFTASYFFAAVLDSKSAVNGFIYIILISFCQIIFTAEFLSTFYKIQEFPFLCINALFAVTAFFIWYKCGKPLYKPCINDFIRKFLNSCKSDKSLIFLFLGWCFFIFVSLMLIVLLPVTSGDGFCYHIVRSYDWVINQSLAHYETADMRMVSFPINSELLYMWVILFTKKQLCLGIFSFVGYFLFLTSSFNIFKLIGYSMRRTLWTLLIISSFASVVVMVSGTETDLIIAGLVTASVYLFFSAVKNKTGNVNLYMSALAYAIAVGVKTPAIICIPAVGFLYLFLSLKFKDKYSLPKFLGFAVINFILFSSYNYVLNFLDFGNMMGEAGAVLSHKNAYGIRGMFANLIKHLCLLIDFSGIRISNYLGQKLLDSEVAVLNFLHLGDIPEGIYSGDIKFYFNTTLSEPGMGCGILSFLFVIPCWIISMVAPLFKKRRFITFQAVFAYMFLINLIMLSAIIAFMSFNTRFITAYILISAPMLACSYIKSNKNPIKIFLVIVSIFYFTVISTHLWGRPFFKLIKETSQIGVRNMRSEVPCMRYDRRLLYLEEWCNINALLDSKFNNKQYKTLIMPMFSENILYTRVKKLHGYQYDFINMEHLKNINVDKYDIIVVPQNGQAVTYFDKYSPDKIDYHLSINVFPQNKNLEVTYYPLNPKSEILCSYKGLNGSISKELGNVYETPIKKICTFTINFYNKHPFAYAYRTKEYYILLNTKTFPEFEKK